MSLQLVQFQLDNTGKAESLRMPSMIYDKVFYRKSNVKRDL